MRDETQLEYLLRPFNKKIGDVIPGWYNICFKVKSCVCSYTFHYNSDIFSFVNFSIEPRAVKCICASKSLYLKSTRNRILKIL